jgi:hypothetical protein
MHQLLAALASAVVAVTSVQDPAAQPTDPCRFRVVSRPQRPVHQTGPEELASRLRVLLQPDSPVVVTGIDLTASRLTTVPGFFEWQGGYAVDVLNIADRPVRRIHVMVKVRFEELSGIGGGVTWDETVAPGQQVRLVSRRGGSGHGVRPGGQDVTVDVAVESVTFDGCEYRPSQAIPVAALGK